MASLIEKFFSTPIPEKLWHYTSMAALEGILSTQRIFATEARHTTDPEEFVHARQVAVDYLARMDAVDDRARRSRESSQQVIEMAFGAGGPLSANHHEVFVASFSGSMDKRSQWDLYASQRAGVSIGFDLRAIRPPTDINSGVSFAPCIYVDREKEALLEEALEVWNLAREEVYRESEDPTAVRKWKENEAAWDRYFGVSSSRAELIQRKVNEFRKKLRPAVEQTSFDLLRIASHCKAGKFLDEDEWRLALPHAIGKSFKYSKIEYRGPKGDVPYVAHNLFNFRLPITEVMLGPECDALTRVRTLLAVHRVPALITRSKLT